MRVSILFAAAALTLAAIAPAAAHEGHDGMETPAAAIDITGGRIVVSPGPNAAGFATIHNGGAADRLIAVKGDAANAIELHEMADEGGMMKMRPVDGVDIPAGGDVALEPGGLHVMLIGLKAPLAPGAEVELVFVFEKAGDVSAVLPVESAGGGHEGHGMH